MPGLLQIKIVYVVHELSAVSAAILSALAKFVFAIV